MHLITDLDVGGAEIMLSRLVSAADRERFHMRVVSMMKPGDIGAELLANQIEVNSLGMRRGIPDLWGLARLVVMLRREPVDLLQTWLYHADLLGLLAARMARVPSLVWNLRTSNMDMSRYSRLSAALPRLLARFSHWPDAVLLNSVAGKAAHERLGYRARRWEIIPNGIDIELFRPDPNARAWLRAQLGLPHNAFVICMPARFDPAKDHATFIAAATQFADMCDAAHFILVGRDCDARNAKLGSLLQRSGRSNRISLLGERRDMPFVLAAADVVSLSSCFGEGFPNVLVEAMACAVPVTSTDVGDSTRIVGDAGRIVPPRDHAALVATWSELYAVGVEARGALGQAARRRVAQTYALSATVARYESFYEQLIKLDHRIS